MKKRVILRIIGSILFIAGFLFLANSFSGITGLVVFEGVGKSVSWIAGLMLVGVGVLLLAAAHDWNRYRVNLIIREYESGELNPVQAALKINNGLYPKGLEITGVNYNGNNPTDANIKTREGVFHARLNNREKAQDLVIALYEIAIINKRENAANCKLEFGKQASSKHHKGGLKDIIGAFEEDYKKDLAAVGR